MEHLPVASVCSKAGRVQCQPGGGSKLGATAAEGTATSSPQQPSADAAPPSPEQPDSATERR